MFNLLFLPPHFAYEFFRLLEAGIRCVDSKHKHLLSDGDTKLGLSQLQMLAEVCNATH